MIGVKAPGLGKVTLVDEEEVYRFFGGYLPVASTTTVIIYENKEVTFWTIVCV